MTRRTHAQPPPLHPPFATAAYCHGLVDLSRTRRLERSSVTRCLALPVRMRILRTVPARKHTERATCSTSSDASLFALRPDGGGAPSRAHGAVARAAAAAVAGARGAAWQGGRSVGGCGSAEAACAAPLRPPRVACRAGAGARRAACGACGRRRELGAASGSAAGRERSGADASSRRRRRQRSGARSGGGSAAAARRRRRCQRRGAGGGGAGEGGGGACEGKRCRCGGGGATRRGAEPAAAAAAAAASGASYAACCAPLGALLTRAPRSLHRKKQRHRCRPLQACCRCRRFRPSSCSSTATKYPARCAHRVLCNACSESDLGAHVALFACAYAAAARRGFHLLRLHARDEPSCYAAALGALQRRAACVAYALTFVHSPLRSGSLHEGAALALYRRRVPARPAAGGAACDAMRCHASADAVL